MVDTSWFLWNKARFEWHAVVTELVSPLSLAQQFGWPWASIEGRSKRRVHLRRRRTPHKVSTISNGVKDIADKE